MKNLACIAVATFLFFSSASPFAQAQSSIRNESAVDTLISKMQLNMLVCVELLRSSVMIGEWPECGAGDGRAIQYEFQDALESAGENPELTALLIESQSLFLALAGRISPFEDEELPEYRDRIVAAIDSVNAQLEKLAAAQN